MGDFGTQKMAVVNQVVTIHCVFVSKNDRMHFRTEMLHASKEKVDELLNAIQEKSYSPFVFIRELFWLFILITIIHVYSLVINKVNYI